MAISSSALAAVPGWLPPADRALFDTLLAQQSESGDLAELGVYQGKTAIVIGSHLRSGETFTVVDLFEESAEDAANSTENDREYSGLMRNQFEANYLKFFETLPNVVTGPSTSILQFARHKAHRFVHIDASHLYQHVVADIEAARLLLQEDGIVVLDDIRSAHTPGVAAAAWAAVANGLRPFAITMQKLYATWGDPTTGFTVARDWAANRPHEVQDIGGHAVLRTWDEQPTAARLLPPALVPFAKRVNGLLGR